MPPCPLRSHYEAGTAEFGENYLSPDGRFVACIVEGSALVWDADSGEHRRAILINDDAAHGFTSWLPALVGFSPDGKKLVTATGDKVQTWRIAFRPEDKNKPAEGRRGLEMEVSAVTWTDDAVFSPDGNRLLICGESESGVRDAATGECLLAVQHFGRHKEIFECQRLDAPVGSFSPDGKRIVIGLPADDYATVWDIEGR